MARFDRIVRKGRSSQRIHVEAAASCATDTPRRSDFVAFAARYGVPEQAVSTTIDKILAVTDNWGERLHEFAPRLADAARAAAALRRR